MQQRGIACRGVLCCPWADGSRLVRSRATDHLGYLGTFLYMYCVTRSVASGKTSKSRAHTSGEPPNPDMLALGCQVNLSQGLSPGLLLLPPCTPQKKQQQKHEVLNSGVRGEEVGGGGCMRGYGEMGLHLHLRTVQRANAPTLSSTNFKPYAPPLTQCRAILSLAPNHFFQSLLPARSPNTSHPPYLGR